MIYGTKAQQRRAANRKLLQAQIDGFKQLASYLGTPDSYGLVTAEKFIEKWTEEQKLAFSTAKEAALSVQKLKAVPNPSKEQEDMAKLKPAWDQISKLRNRCVKAKNDGFVITVNREYNDQRIQDIEEDMAPLSGKLIALRETIKARKVKLVADEKIVADYQTTITEKVTGLEANLKTLVELSKVVVPPQGSGDQGSGTPSETQLSEDDDVVEE